MKALHILCSVALISTAVYADPGNDDDMGLNTLFADEPVAKQVEPAAPTQSKRAAKRARSAARKEIAVHSPKIDKVNAYLADIQAKQADVQARQEANNKKRGKIGAAIGKLRKMAEGLQTEAAALKAQAADLQTKYDRGTQAKARLTDRISQLQQKATAPQRSQPNKQVSSIPDAQGLSDDELTSLNF